MEYQVTQITDSSEESDFCLDVQATTLVKATFSGMPISQDNNSSPDRDNSNHRSLELPKVFRDGPDPSEPVSNFNSQRDTLFVGTHLATLSPTKNQSNRTSSEMALSNLVKS